jgi:hypothetical protein
MTALDPIAELNRDLSERGLPSLAWTVRWSQAGGDPVRAAWEASNSVDAMLMFIRHALGRFTPELMLVAWRATTDAGTTAEYIRAAVPHVPTLAEVLALHAIPRANER